MTSFTEQELEAKLSLG